MRRFGELESALLEAMWAIGRPCTVHEVIDQIADGPPAYTTTITVLERMRTKGWLTRRRAGRAYQYMTVHTKSEHTAHLMEETLAASPDRSAALLSFAGRLEEHEVEQLRRALRTDDPPRM